MANAIYPLYKENILSAQTDSSLTGGVLKVALVDTGTYTYSASHEFFDDVTGVVGTPETITNVTVTGAVVDGDDVTFTAVTGSTVEALIVFLDTGTPSTSRLVMYQDTSVTGLPVTPNGGDITVQWNGTGIFAL